MKSIIPAFLALCLIGGRATAQSHEGHGGGSHELHKSMTKGSEQMQSMEMSGDLDHDFVKTMLMHHRHGVEMARIQVEQGKDPKAKEFAKKVIESQNKEIKQYETWLSTHGEGKTDKR